MKNAFTVTGNLADVHRQRIYQAQIDIAEGRIRAIHDQGAPVPGLPYILPGFVDAHIHIESSMLVPSQFARLAVVHGTVATVSDPHEIANVCGLEGIEFMIEDGRRVPFKFNFGAPSCVPATAFETAGATIGAEAIDKLLQRRDILYLSEMMNFPGVLHGDAEVLQKIAAAKKWNKPVDGHAPGLRGDAARRYIAAGISTDHECFTIDEALDKLAAGMKIIIREGSAAKNFEALAPLIQSHPHEIMFCSDDKHPDALVEGHINTLCARAVAKGHDLFKVLRAASVNPVLHYKLKVGLLRQNDFADFILVRDLQHFEVLQTYIDGMLVAENGVTRIDTPSPGGVAVNRFHCSARQAQDFVVAHDGPTARVQVIEALEGQLITNKSLATLPVKGGAVMADPTQDVLKIAVVNRYRGAPPAVAFIRNFGLQRGAIASTVAHDSHNIVAIGVDDASLARAVNALIAVEGGVSCADAAGESVLPLPVGGLMSTEDGYAVAQRYAAIDAAAKTLGSTLAAPYMTLSFMALLVIPHLKLSDLGLFDGDTFGFAPLVP